MKKNAIVIGAGAMGLVAAYRLLKEGYEVNVYERDSKVGGMSSHFDFDGLDIERFYHFICKTDHPYFALLEELGLSDTLQWKDTKMGYFYQDKLYPWGNPLALLRFPKLGLIPKLRYAAHAFLSTKRSNWSKLDHMEATAWIQKWIGQKAYDILWKKLFELKFYHYTGNLSAAWIWTRIKRVGLSRKSIFTESMGFLEGGSETLFDKLSSEIQRLGGKIHLSTPVSKIKVDGQKKLISTKLGEENTDLLISTAALPNLPNLFEGIDVQKYAAVANIAVVCVIVKLTEAVTENFWLNINDERIQIPGLVEYSNLNPLKDTVVYAPYYLPQDHELYQKDDAYFKTQVQEYLTMINPEITAEKILAIQVHRCKYAQPICPPEYLKSLPPIHVSDGLYIADTSYYYPEDRSISESIGLANQIIKEIL